MGDTMRQLRLEEEWRSLGQDTRVARCIENLISVGLLTSENVGMEPKVTPNGTIPPEHSAPTEDWDGMFDALQSCSHATPEDPSVRIDRDHVAALIAWADGEGLD